MWVSEGRMEMRHARSQVSLNTWMEQPFCRTLWVTDSQGVVGLHSQGPDRAPAMGLRAHTRKPQGSPAPGETHSR